jgi:hypothetical protein
MAKKAMWLTKETPFVHIRCKRNLGWLYWCRSKTVIASQAFAKISMRLVPNQEWEHITELFTKHFKSIAPDSVCVTPITEVRAVTPSVTRPLTWLIRRLLSSGYSCSFWRKYSYCSFVWKELKAKQSYWFDSDAIHSKRTFRIFNYLKGMKLFRCFTNILLS